jgi:plastocyanin
VITHRAGKAAAAAAVLLLTVGCSSNSTTVDIATTNFAFEPGQLTVPAGETVTFKLDNNDQVEHNLTIEGLQVNQDVDAGENVKVKTKSKVAAGSYPFFCSYHRQRMTGTFIVS